MQTRPHLAAQSQQNRATGLMGEVDELRTITNRLLDPKRRVEFGQFMTPAPVASLMGSMIGRVSDAFRILDAGAGVGSLTAAAVQEILLRATKPKEIHVTAFEVDPVMVASLRATVALCATECERSGVNFSAEIIEEDFLLVASQWLSTGLFQSPTSPRFDLAIQNPPYKKINTASRARLLSRAIGVETSNLYTAFLAATIHLLSEDGQLVAICPRSFCNGPYFRPFRELFLREMSLRRIHVFGSRLEAFKEDEVLQETVIVSAYRNDTSGAVQVSTSTDALAAVSSRIVPMSDVVNPDDPQIFIHIRAEDDAERVAAQMASLPCTLAELGLTVSTGRVVDFRAKKHLRSEPDAETVPLLYPGHFDAARVTWPRSIRKPNALHFNEETFRLLVPRGHYVLTKRFSSKEERRRVVAAVLSPDRVPGEHVAIENHLNYFHRRGAPLDAQLARGLTAFLNTDLVDDFFRQFNGHTQVNATDLRSLRYPSEAQLRRMGSEQNDAEGLDELLKSVVA